MKPEPTGTCRFHTGKHTHDECDAWPKPIGSSGWPDYKRPAVPADAAPVAAAADTARSEVISAGTGKQARTEESGLDAGARAQFGEEWAEARKLRVRMDSERKLRLAALALAAHYAVPPTNTDREHGKLDRALQRAAVRFTVQHPELLR